MKARIDFPQADGQRLRLAFAAPLELLVARDSAEVTDVIAAAERQARAGRWAVGYIAYEAAAAFDAALKTRPPTGGLPLAVFAIYAAPTEEVPAAEGFTCGPWRMATPPQRSIADIADLRRRIAAGDFYQVNLTTRLRADFAGSSRALFEALRATQPAGYCAHLQGGAWEILSVSPELFFDWQTGESGGTLTTQPMKGTAPRHADPAADAAAAAALQASPKERAENLMIVDLLRNDLARVATTGTVRVPRLFVTEALPTAWQMSSTVQCATRPGTTLADVFRALFPCGSVTGAPKVAAMAAIAELEDAPRGAYCGAIGLIRPGGHASFNVGIRTVVLDVTNHGAGRAECGVGSGIVFDSAGPDEYAEWLVKRRFLLRATAHFELLETLRLAEGNYWLLERHLQRLAASAEHFGFSLDPARVEQALAELAARLPTDCWRVRLLCDRQGGICTEAFTLEAAPPEVAVVVALAAAPIGGDAEFLLHKTTERSAYAGFEPAAGVFDTLLWNAQGEITEFTRGNVVIELAGRRVTPPVTSGLLPGVLRAKLLARGEIEEATVRRDALAQASGLWFINSVRGMLPARLLPGA